MPHKFSTTVSTAPYHVRHINTVPMGLWLLARQKASVANRRTRLRPPTIVTEGTGEDSEVDEGNRLSSKRVVERGLRM